MKKSLSVSGGTESLGKYVAFILYRSDEYDVHRLSEFLVRVPEAAHIIIITEKVSQSLSRFGKLGLSFKILWFLGPEGRTLKEVVRVIGTQPDKIALVSNTGNDSLLAQRLGINFVLLP